MYDRNKIREDAMQACQISEIVSCLGEFMLKLIMLLKGEMMFSAIDTLNIWINSDFLCFQELFNVF